LLGEGMHMKKHGPGPWLMLTVCVMVFSSAPGFLSAQSTAGNSVIRGTIADPAGAVVQGATILITRQNDAQGDLSLGGQTVQTTAQTTADSSGRFSFSGLAPGSYTITARITGFSTMTRAVELGVSETATVDLTAVVAVGEEGGTSDGGGSSSSPPPQHKFDGLTWNVWEEKYSSKPSFEPIQKLLVGKQYSLVLDLSALKYNEDTGSFSRSTSTSFDAWLKGNLASQATLDVLVVPDERFFQPQRDDERVKKFDIDLDKLRQTRQQGFQMQESPFSYLKSHNDASFTFGRQLFRIQAKKLTGSAAIALSIWVDGRPVDEISIPLCIVKDMNDSCSAIQPLDMSLKGVDSISRGVYPDAALQLIELDPSTLVGVFRCNSCSWKSDEYRTWTLG
jgi:hypothetical protein